MDLLSLYYKKYKNIVEASDYVNWAQHMLYTDCHEITKLASMTEPLNLFEMESMFERSMKAIRQEEPREEDCVAYHLKELHAKLLSPNVGAISIVKELYHFVIAEDLYEEQMRWYIVSELIDYFEYDGTYNMTKEELNEKVIMHACMHARELWHTQRIEGRFSEFIGQKVIDIETGDNFSIQFGKGALAIECPWRIRNADIVLVGETDSQTNEDAWKSVKQLLSGTTILDVQLFENCPLLIVQCDDLYLDLFHASSNFDGWILKNEEDSYIYSMHGGQVV